MSSLRLDYQRKIVRETEGAVLNVGCNTDPAWLKGLFGDRVTNHDFVSYDEWLQLDLPVDMVFDVTEDWPVSSGTFGLIVMGDIIEHLAEDGAVFALREARRVGNKLCVTVPNDTRLGPGWNSDGSRRPESEWVEAPGSYHVQTVTEEKLSKWLAETGWEVTDWREVPYGFCPVGYFVTAV